MAEHRAVARAGINRCGKRCGHAFLIRIRARRSKQEILRVVSFLAVFGEIEARRFGFDRHSHPAEQELDDEADHSSADDGQKQNQPAGFHLFHPKFVAVDESLDVLGVQVRVRIRRCEDPGKQNTQRPADCVHTEGVERVIVAERNFQFRARKERRYSRNKPDDDRVRWRNKTTGGRDRRNLARR